MINIVIFSRDRAAQLELLLRSFKRFFLDWNQANVTVIYKVTGGGTKENPLYQGYKLCEQLHPEFNYLPEDMCESFKQATLNAVNVENPLTMFLVDDIVFKSPMSLSDEEFAVTFAGDPNVLCLSLRLYEGINYCYPIGKSVSVPSSVLSGENTWNWVGQEGDWGYPLSLDGHVFTTETIRPFLENLEYKNPNTLEASMSINTELVQNAPLMACYRANSKLLNVPANRVQDTFNNRVGNLVTVEELNEKFLSKQRISLEPFIECKNNAPHVELSYAFEEVKE